MSVTVSQKSLIAYDDFELHLNGRISISMPPYPEVTSHDVDAQLFSFISNAPKAEKLVSIADLDDAWVQANFPDIQTIEKLRAAIRARVEQENAFAYQNLKFARVSDALVACLQGSITQEAIDQERDAISQQSKMKIHASGESLYQYLKREDLTEEQYEHRIDEETKYQISLTIALEKYVEMNGLSVPEEELTSYLETEDPTLFLATLHETGRVAEAKQAAARVKAMRQLVDEAEVSIKDDLCGREISA